jgi:hypothetical protein
MDEAKFLCLNAVKVDFGPDGKVKTYTKTATAQLCVEYSEIRERRNKRSKLYAWLAPGTWKTQTMKED